MFFPRKIRVRSISCKAQEKKLSSASKALKRSRAQATALWSTEVLTFDDALDEVSTKSSTDKGGICVRKN